MKYPFEQISDLIIANNHRYIIFNKPVALPAQPDQTGDKSLLELGSAYCKTQLYPAHRIDRPTSGIVIFAKTSTAAANLSEQLRDRQANKTYLAVVSDHPPKMEEDLVHYLTRDGRARRSRVSQTAKPGAKMAKLSYKYLAGSERYHLLEVKLHTGRFHQIRAQLSAINCPIRGDVKYGARRKNQDRGIDLHAYQVQLANPSTGEEETWLAPPPDTGIWRAFEEFIAV